MTTQQDWGKFISDIFRENLAFNDLDGLSHFLRLLLIKYLSDLTDTESNPISNYFSEMPSEIHWNNFVKAKYLGEELDNAVIKISESNPKLKDVFGEAKFDKIPEKNLSEILSKFKDIKIDQLAFALSSPFATVAENAIDFIARGKEFGGQYSPKWITKLLVGLLNPQENTTIHDPVCGTGSLFIESAKFLSKSNADFSTLEFSGQEINKDVYQICQMNLLLHGLDNFEIQKGDTLRDPKFIEGKKLKNFDAVIANPPLILSDWGYEEAKLDRFERFRYGIPPKKNGDFAFIQHIISTLKDPSGKAVILVPPGVLFRTGSSEQNIRSGIIDSGIIEAVIGLPTNLLYSTGIPTAILILNRNKIENRKVLIIDANKEFQKLTKGTNFLDDKNIENIISLYNNFQDQEGVAKVLTIEEIASNDYQLNSNRYITTPRQVIDIKEQMEELSQMEEIRICLENKMNQCLQELGIDL